MRLVSVAETNGHAKRRISSLSCFHKCGESWDTLIVPVKTMIVASESMLFDFVVGTLVLGNIAKVYQVVGTKYIERATYCTQ